jgi:hypothetical protein
MISSRLFYLDRETGDVIIDDNYVKTVPEFNALYKRKKEQGMKELKFVFFMADWTAANYLRDYDDKQRSNLALKDSKLSNDWTPDAAVGKAITKYINIQIEYSGTIKMLITLRRAIMSKAEAVDLLDRQNKRLLSRIEQLMTEDTMGYNVAELATIDEAIAAANEKFVNNSKTITTLTTDYERGIKLVNDLETKVKEETEAMLEITGKRKLGNRELPTERAWAKLI